MAMPTDNGDPDNQQNFQVDLGGVVDLLSRHLYSGPRVYLRELLQNAVDAVAARGEYDRDGTPATPEILVRRSPTHTAPAGHAAPSPSPTPASG
jgi:molecular chaperone HtpG